MMCMKNRIAATIKNKRLQKGFTQEVLAEFIGKTPGYIGQVERGETYPSAVVLAKIIEVLGIDANTLFFDTEENALVSHEISIRAARLSPEKQEFVLEIISLLEHSFRKDGVP